MFTKNCKSIHARMAVLVLAILLNSVMPVSASLTSRTAAEPPGTLDTTFGMNGIVTTDFGGYDLANSMAVQPGGKIIVAGVSSDNCALARYNSDGSLDSTFSGDGKRVDYFGGRDACLELALQSDGKILMAGSSDNRFLLARYNNNGSLDTTFDVDGKVTTKVGSADSYAGDVAIQSNGKIVVAGSYIGSSYFDYSGFAVVRYNSNGSLDTTFGTNGIVTTALSLYAVDAPALVIQSDGKILVAGDMPYRISSDFAVARYNLNGSLDPTFGMDGIVITDFDNSYDHAAAIALQPNGKIVVAGFSEGGSDDFALARYNPDGSLDTTFDTDGKVLTDTGHLDRSSSVVIQLDGKIIVAGRTDYFVDEETYFSDIALLRYNHNGAPDTTFDTDGIVTLHLDNWDVSGSALAIQPGDKIVVAAQTDYDFTLARFYGDDFAPSLVSPADAETLLHKRPTFDWENIPNAGGYQIAASKTTSFSTPLWNVTTTTSSYTPPADLPAGTVIYWRVRAQVSGVWGPCSQTWSFRTANPPSIPVLVSPAHKTLSKDYTPLLNWSDSTGANFSHYEAQVDMEKLFTDPVLIKNDTLTASSYTPDTNLAADTRYFWRVRAFNTAGEYSSWSTVWSFWTVMSPPSNLIPADGAIVSNRRPVLHWDGVAGASGYNLQISTSKSFATLLFNTTSTTNGFTPTTKFPANTLIYWRVRATGTNGPSRWTTTSFHTP